MGNATVLLESYDEARLLWEAKGWAMDDVADELKSRPELAGFDLSQPTLSRLTRSGSDIPPTVAAAIEALETLPKHEHLTEIVETGLRVLRGQPMSSKRDPRELAQALLAHFPTNEIASNLADALVTESTGRRAQLAKVARHMARLVAKRLAHRDTTRSGKLHMVAATLNHVDAKLDLAEIQRQKDTQEIIRAIWSAALTTVGCAVLLFGALLFLSGRVQAAHAPAATSTNQPAIIVTNVATGSLPSVFDIRVLLSAVSMGKKVEERWIPSKPFPLQKLAQHCDPDLGEEPINGGCWVALKNLKPPCGKLYRHGDTCYRPVAADPNTPVGEQEDQ